MTKRLCIIFLFLTTILPASAKDTALSSPPSTPLTAELNHIKQTLSELSLSKEQTKALSAIVMGQLPLLLNPNSDPLALAFEVAPQIEELLEPAQRAAFERLAQEALPVILKVSSMDKSERQQLIESELAKLSFPSLKEWVRRAKALER